MTLGLAPRAAHVFQNWCNLAPIGRPGDTTVSFLTFWTKLHCSTEVTPFTYFNGSIDVTITRLKPLFYGCPTKKGIHICKKASLHLKSDTDLKSLCSQSVMSHTLEQHSNCHLYDD